MPLSSATIYGRCVDAIGHRALELAPKKRRGTAAGFTDLCLVTGGSMCAASAIVRVIPLTLFRLGWRLYGDWRHSGGNPAGGRIDDWRKRHRDELQLKRNGG